MNKYPWMLGYNSAAIRWNECREKLKMLQDSPQKTEAHKELQHEGARLVAMLMMVRMGLTEQDLKNLGLDPDLLPVAVDAKTGEVEGFCLFKSNDGPAIPGYDHFFFEKV